MSSAVVRQWYRDLAMGVRFTFTGGREGWVRAVLTAVGVGLGVALLLLTAAIPNALATRQDREQAREDRGIGYLADNSRSKPTDKSLIVADTDTEYQHQEIRGRLLEPEGVDAPLPPGVGKFPAPGEMLVSPALSELLRSDAGELLRGRLPYDTVGTIGETGLIGPGNSPTTPAPTDSPRGSTTRWWPGSTGSGCPWSSSPRRKWTRSCCCSRWSCSWCC